MHKLSIKLAALALAASSLGLTQTAAAGDRVTLIYSSGSYHAAPHSYRHYHGHRGGDYRHHRYERRHHGHEHGHHSHYRKFDRHSHKRHDSYDRKRGHERGYKRGHDRYGRYRDSDRHGGHRADSHSSAERRDRNDHRVKHTAHVSRHVF
jgi:hypothetical protein